MKAAAIAMLLTFAAVLPQRHEVLKQAEIGSMGCGPCAVINGLQAMNRNHLLESLNGDTALDKAKSFIDSYGGLPSKIYPDREVYTEKHGMTDVDLKQALNTFLNKAEVSSVEGCYLVRHDDEEKKAFVKRVHGLLNDSLDLKFAPLLFVRPAVAEYDGERDQHLWNSKSGHIIAIESVGEISEDGLGFLIHFSDSLSGERLTGYVYLDTFRKCTVPMKFTVDDNGDEQWDWISGENCLMLTAPGIPLYTSKAHWYQRTYIALRYILYCQPDISLKGN